MIFWLSVKPTALKGQTWIQ